jgi:hypothetical protein
LRLQGARVTHRPRLGLKSDGGVALSIKPPVLFLAEMHLVQVQGMAAEALRRREQAPTEPERGPPRWLIGRLLRHLRSG